MDRIRNLKKSTLIKLGFYQAKNPAFRDNCIFKKTLILRKYKDEPILFGIIHVEYPSGNYYFDMYDNKQQLYAPFYEKRFGAAYRDYVGGFRKKMKREIDLVKRGSGYNRNTHGYKSNSQSNRKKTEPHNFMNMF